MFNEYCNNMRDCEFSLKKSFRSKYKIQSNTEIVSKINIKFELKHQK